MLGSSVHSKGRRTRSRVGRPRRRRAGTQFPLESPRGFKQSKGGARTLQRGLSSAQPDRAPSPAPPAARKAMKHAQQPQNAAQRKSRSKHASSRTTRWSFLCPCLPSMRNIFNFARFCVYLAIIAWTVVVLAIAAHFEQMLVASDLTRFVPLAIFISVMTLLVIGALLMAPHVLRHNYVTTRIEVMLLSLLALFWITLGVYTAAVEIGEVECFADEDETEPIEVQGFTTEEYQAQYRALEGFSIINAFLLLGFTIFVLALSCLQTRKGLSAWSTPMPLFPWLSRRHGRHNSTKLPAPVTSKEPKAVPPMATKATAPMATKAPAPVPAPARTAARAPAAPVRTKSQPAPVAPPRAPARAYTAPAPAPRPPATGAKLTPAPPRPTVQRSATMAAATASAPRADASRPTPYRSATMAAASKPKNYSSQYQRPSAGIPQTKTGAPGQSSYQYYTGPKLPAPPPAARTGQRSAAAPPQRR